MPQAGQPGDPHAGADSELNGSTERTPLIQNVHNMLGTNTDHPLYKDERPYVRWPAHVVHITWQILLSNYVNVLLIFVPLGIIAGAVGWAPTAIFLLNFFAIIPLASLLSFATEELSVPLGQTLGGLLNATFGNAVELIVRLAGNPLDVFLFANVVFRSVSLPCATMRSELFKRACWVASCPTSYLY